jgi:hypothetical protein
MPNISERFLPVVPSARLGGIIFYLSLGENRLNMSTEQTEHTEDQQPVTAKSLLAQLKRGKKLHDEFAAQFRESYTIAGQSIGEWKAYFRVKIPPDLNTQTCQEVDVRLIELHQEASFLKAEAEARLSAYRSANNDRYRARFAQLISEYEQAGKKRPAQGTIDTLAEHAIGDIKNALVHAELELAFWKEILSDLQNSRKIIKNITINLSVEAKALLLGNYDYSSQ